MQRRTFLALSLSLIASVPLIRWVVTPKKKEGPGEGDKKVLHFSDLYGEDIRAITAVLLPSDLDRNQTDLVVRNFLAWLADQDPQAEMSYSFMRISRDLLSRVVPGAKRNVIEVTSYENQISKFRTLAGDKKLSGLNRSELRGLLDPYLVIPTTGPHQRFPTGKNLLWDITVFYFTSGEALDLFYGRKIGKQTPRSLVSVTTPPEEL